MMPGRVASFRCIVGTDEPSAAEAAASAASEAAHLLRALDARSAELTAAAAAAAEADQPAREALEILRGARLFAAPVPHSYGGLGLDAGALNRVVERLAWIDGSLAIVLFQHFAVTTRIADWGIAALRDAVLPRLASGAWLAASAWSETGAGADKRSLATTAVPSANGGWMLEGAKSFVTGGELAAVILVLATTSAARGGEAGLYGAPGQSFFIVETALPGVRRERGPDLVGMRGSATGLLALERCELGADALLGPLGEATRVIVSVRMHGLTLGAVAVGLAQRACEMAEEQLLGRGLLRHQATRHRLADLRAQVGAARAMVESVAPATEAERGTLSLQSKIVASERAEAVVADCQRLLGSAGFMRGHAINRIANDVRAVGLMGPTNDLCREILSELGTG